MTIEELSSVLQMQEEILQFSSFTNADAWELGNLIVAEAAKRGAAVLVRIRLNNGYTVFQYGMDGTNLYHEQWLTRKENTVRLTEKSSLRMYMDLRERGESLADRFLDEKEYAACGGGFPIRVEEVGVIGTIAITGLDHVSEHDLLVKFGMAQTAIIGVLRKRFNPYGMTWFRLSNMYIMVAGVKMMIVVDQMVAVVATAGMEPANVMEHTTNL